MNYRQAGIFTDRSTIELKTEFEDILTAMQEIGRPSEEMITAQMLDFWLYGSPLVNLEIYLLQLNVEDALVLAGIPKEFTGYAINSPIDKYVLFKNACLHFIGEEFTDDFKHLVVNPLIEMYVKPSKKSQENILTQRETAQTLIKSITPDLKRAIAQFNKIPPHTLSGTTEELIFIELKKVEFLINNNENLS